MERLYNEAMVRTTAAKAKRQELVAGAQRTYTLSHLVILFFSFCAIGYVWEVALDLVQRGELVNRGVLYGPWLPIYGIAGVLMVLLCRRFLHKPGQTFFFMMAVSGVVEYSASWIIEAITGLRWWDYSFMPFDLDGRIDPFVLVFFAAAGMAAMYVIAPKMDEALKRVSNKTKWVVCGALATLFTSDVLVALLASPNTHAL